MSFDRPCRATPLLVLVIVALAGCSQLTPLVDDDTSGDGSTAEASGTSDSADTGTTTVATGTSLDDTGTGSSTSDTEGTPSCGNGLVEAGEACDDTGESATCDVDCTAVECGDGTINAAAGEECEGAELAEGTCETLGFDGGTLACGAACSYETSGCADVPAAPVLSLELSPVKRFDFSWSAVDGAAYYQLEESAAPGEPFVPIATDILGESISLTMPLYLRHQASYLLRACNELGCTESPVVDVMGSLVEAVGYFKASNTDSSDTFGYSVALSEDGSTLVVGAYNEDGSATGIDGDQADDTATSAGAVFVFVRDALGAWSQQAYIKASNTDEHDVFGIDVALSLDGNTLAVGAAYEESTATGIDGDQASNGAPFAGAVYMFVRDGAGAWSQQAYIKASNTDAYDSFGGSVALSHDGHTLAVGAMQEDGSASGVDGDGSSDATPDSGAAYVFVRDGLGAWSQQAYVKASNPDPMDYFGWCVTLSGDGDRLAVSANVEDGSATGIDGAATNAASDAGAVYVFERDGAGAWSQQAYVKASNTDAHDFFGMGVALSGDGETLAVGAIHEDSSATGVGGDQADDTALSSGAVYVFTHNESGAWVQEAYVKASTAGGSDFFGHDLTLSSNGDLLAVAAISEDSDAVALAGNEASNAVLTAGAVYVFERDPVSGWAQRVYAKATNPGAGDQFGDGLALSGDGNTLAVGAFLEDGGGNGVDAEQNELNANAGAVYLY